MSSRLKRGPALFRILLMAMFAVFLQPAWSQAGQAGTFEGTLTASGHRHMFDFQKGRPVFTFAMEGHVNLANAVGATGDFWATWVGLWDAKTGGTIRCVWDDMKGQKIFVELSGTRMKAGASLTGQFVGGTGAYQGIEGNFIFTWTTLAFDADDEIIAGYAKDVKGTYRIP